MARFSKLFRPQGGSVYDLEIRVDGSDRPDAVRTIEIAARSYTDEDRLELAARLEIDAAANAINLSVEGVGVARLSLDDVRIADADDADTGQPGADALAAIGDAAGINLAAAIEEAIGWIPVPDPVLGCLLKGAIAATAGQIVRCYVETDGADGGARRARAIARCVGANAWALLGRAGRRAFRCFLQAGFG